MKITPQIRAFLKLITWLEANVKGVNPYYLYVFNGFKVPNLSKHPKELGAPYIKNSSASGAYQIVYKTYLGLKRQLNTKDFSEATQDRMAVELLKSRNAINDIENGYIEEAIKKCRYEWEAFDKVLKGTYNRSLNECIEQFRKFGGVALVKTANGYELQETTIIDSLKKKVS